MKQIISLIAFLSIAVIAQNEQYQNPQDQYQAPSHQYQDLQKFEYMKIKGNYDDLDDFYNAAQIGFSQYFKKYSPKVYLKNAERLVMFARYGKYDVKCIFYIKENGQYIVSIDTEFPGDKTRWLANVVKHVEKRGN